MNLKSRNTKALVLVLLIPILTLSLLSFSNIGPQASTLDLSAVSSNHIIMETSGIKGTSQESFARDAHDILSYAWAGFSTQGSEVGSSRDSSRPSLTEVQVVKEADMASPHLFSACMQGTSFEKVTISHYRVDSSGNDFKYLELELETATCTLYAFSGVSDDSNLEQLSFNYEKIRYQFTEQRSDGSTGDTVEKGWDVEENKEP
ncbi:MAG: Hcp family type VI secretion system effector [Candidatus Hodarchaeales archaeon]|jgi:type VI secretion system secreted protein Hcp